MSSLLPTDRFILETDLFYQGIRPALNVGLSVSRVGSAAQTKAMKKVAGKLRLDLAQYRELAAFAQFGSDLDEATQKQINRGSRLTELLKQDQFQPLKMEEQVVALYAGVNGYLDDIAVTSVKAFEKGLVEYLESNKSGVLEEISSSGELAADTEEKLKKAIGEYQKLLPGNPKSQTPNFK